MTEARTIQLLASLREFGCLGARLGVRARLAQAPAESQALVRALFAEPPRLTWDDGDWLAGALLEELGLRAAHALRRARRRARRKDRHDGTSAGV